MSYYSTAKLADHNGSGTRERLAMESTYESPVEGRKRFYVERHNHEVGVSLTIEEYSPGSTSKRGYTRQIFFCNCRERLSES